MCFSTSWGKKLGIDRLAWYAKACGLGDTHGASGWTTRGAVSFPPPPGKRTAPGFPGKKGRRCRWAIGQGYNLATPLQMAMLIAAVANGGTRYQPLIMDKIVAPDGRVIFSKTSPGLPARFPSVGKPWPWCARACGTPSTEAAVRPAISGWRTSVSVAKPGPPRCSPGAPKIV